MSATTTSRLATAEPTQALAPTGETPNVLWAMAWLAVLATLASRAVAPALPGVWVGVDHLITAAKLGAAITSQFFAVASTAVVMGLVLATIKSSLPAYHRAFTAGTGVLCILAVMVASATRLPEASRLVLAAAVGALALLGGLLAARFFTSRGAALVVMTVALAGLTRVVTMAVAAYGAGPASYAAVDPAGGSPVLVVVARSTATLSSALEAAALGIAAFWLVTQPRAVAGRLVAPRRPRWLLGLTVLGVVGLASFGLTFGHDPEARGVPLLVARAVEQLLHNPEPYTPAVVRRSLELLRWVLAVALLVAAPRGRMMASVVVLALVATGTLEVPLCAAAIVIAVLALGIHPGPRLFTPEAMEEGGAPTA